jgi:hypothetical protein
MDEKDSLHVNCSCRSCQQLGEAEKKLHIEISQNSRREFFKTAGKLGLGLGIGGGLISPLAASTLHAEESGYTARSLEKVRCCKREKHKCSHCFIQQIFIHNLTFMMNSLLNMANLFIKKGAVLLH